jgi:cytochrome c peroxidase
MPLSLPAQVGEMIFNDPSLSASGQLACATCHDPAHAYSSSNVLAVQLGGPSMSLSGTRAVPSLRYKEYTTPYADLAPNPDGISTPGPGGGFTWDGRADTLAAQAQIPLLAPNEMANASADDVVTKLQNSAYAGLFRSAFGSSVFDSTASAFQDALDALQAYQLEDDDFHPYTSKFDLYAGNKIGGDLSPSELRGLQVFLDPNRGNCNACHYGGPAANGGTGLFTDFTYEAIGVPRNAEIPANADPGYGDMGICSRADHPLPDSAQYCGMFKTPTLRNVAVKKVFFHNGKMKSLREVLNFYNTRDTRPELWYPVAGGVVKEVRRPARGLPGQHRHPGAPRRSGSGLAAADVGAGPRGSAGVPERADRRRPRESDSRAAGCARVRKERIAHAGARAGAAGGRSPGARVQGIGADRKAARASGWQAQSSLDRPTLLRAPCILV